jgi:catechol 2,3-dioxygenase-like lactoylglutathione lyase family enzyme
MIRRMNHVGISVASLKRSIEFYRDLLGMSVVFEGPFAGRQYERILGIQGARGMMAVLQATNSQVELFEFHVPLPMLSDASRPVSNHGITHFCIEVEDIDGNYQRLKSAGVIFHCEPLDFFGAAKATYARDPDGNAFELLELTETVK